MRGQEDRTDVALAEILAQHAGSDLVHRHRSRLAVLGGAKGQGFAPEAHITRQAQAQRLADATSLIAQRCGDRHRVRRVARHQFVGDILLEEDCSALARRRQLELAKIQPVQLQGAPYGCPEHREPAADRISRRVFELAGDKVIPVVLSQFVASTLAEELCQCM
jgi:hypothetical protein